MKSLPIGVQTFRSFVEGNYIYVDKTRHIYNLLQPYQGVYFLSRPRRFGKSLLLSTIEEIFVGNKELFKDLWIYNSDYQWNKYPVIRLDFSKQKAEAPEQLKDFLMNQLGYIANQHNIQVNSKTYYEQFDELIKTLSRKEKVVILIDEYDKPIIDWLDDLELAKKMRVVMKGFFSILKGNAENIRFLLLTGVSKFSKAGVFSDLNHLNDITYDEKYSSMLGITEDELKIFFNEYILDFSNKQNISYENLLEKIRYWYNGYKFSGQGISVYNPFSTLLLFQKQTFRNHWFETGTPTFLLKLMIAQDYPIANFPVKVDEIQISSYDIERMNILPILLQTGYLTIKEYDEERMIYTLDYPNFEVKRAYLTYFFEMYSNRSISEPVIYDILDSLRLNDLDRLFSVLKSYLAGIPYDIQIDLEKYYQTIFFIIFTLLGLKVFVEVKTNIGRIDLVIEDNSIFIFEFKFVASSPDTKNSAQTMQASVARQAIEQIKSKKYPEKYLNKGKPIYLIGAEFKDKNIGEYLVEMI